MLSDLSALTPAIQLAVAPVFLLTAISGFLTVLTNRLGRIIDRNRSLNDLTECLSGDQKIEKNVLDRRATLVNWAISACGLSALFVCILIAGLFLGSLLWTHATLLVSSLFVLAMVSLIVGLLLFLAEISLTIKTVRVIGV